jgi:alpha-tubulin suppressor-like RCC1 family protein
MVGLDDDTVGAVLARLVATSQGTARHLRCCAQVCRLWHAGSESDALWRSLLVQRCGSAMLAAVEESQRAGREPTLTYRALYIRSVTTQVLMWGQAERQGGHSAGHRAPALLEPDDCRSVAVRQIAAGAGFSAMVTWTGRVLCWGVNNHGQCGRPPNEAKFLPEPDPLRLPAASPYAVQVSCGGHHACCVTTCGAVLCWGQNSEGQLGQSASPSFAVNSDGTTIRVPAWDQDCAPACCQVACGSQHTVALATDQRAVYTWGLNKQGIQSDAGVGAYFLCTRALIH